MLTLNQTIRRHAGMALLAAMAVSTALAQGPRPFEARQGEDLHAAVRAQAAMLKAFGNARAPGATTPEDAASHEAVEMRQLAAKSLGDDARDLVFIPVTPCTVWDTRFAAAAPQAGAIGNAVTRKFYSHLDGADGNFSAYGGNPACTEANQTFIGARPYAAMMVVYVNNPVGNGWLTFYRDGDPDPSSATISVYYSPGPTRTQTVISKSSRGYGVGVYDIAVTGRFSTADASASVVGYFLKADSISIGGNLTLVPSTPTAGNVMKGANRFIHNYGTLNTFIGQNAGNFTMTGQGNNTASGADVLSSNTTGSHNTASGVQALVANTTGSSNTASGYQALFSNTTGGSNTAFGVGALALNTEGGTNTATGEGALFANTTGASNTATGVQALVQNTIGNNNTAIGDAALFSNTTGGNNIAVGVQAGINLTTGHSNIAIGNGGVDAEANTIRIGTAQTRAFIAGIRGTTTGIGDAVAVLVDTAGQLGTISSSRRFKEDVADMREASSDLMRLRPVTFHYKSDMAASGRRLQYGLVAEEVAKVYPGLVAHSAGGEVETVMYQFLPTMLLNEYQKQQRTIEALSREVAELRGTAAEVAELKRQTALLVKALEGLAGDGAIKAALRRP